MIDEKGIFPISREAVVARLEAHGILPTAQRVDIAGILLSAPQHLSADQVIERLNLAGSAGSKATVYNTLGLLAERGLLRELIVDASRIFYDSNVEPHHHFYNEDDGTLTDVESAAIALEQLPAAPEGTEVLGVDVFIRIRNSI